MKGSAGYVAIEHVTGTMSIRIEAGKHSCDFEYSIAPAN